jgi:23S rRNA pseudouridine2605 synthase
MRKRDSSGSGSGGRKKPAGRSGARSNSPRSSGSSPRSRDDRGDSDSRGRKTFGRSKDSGSDKPSARGFSSRGDKPFTRSRDDRDDSKPRRSAGFSKEGRSDSKDFSKPRGGKTFGRSKDSGSDKPSGRGFSSRSDKPFSRSREDRDDSKPRRSSGFSREGRGDSKDSENSRSRDESRPRRSSGFSKEERGDTGDFAKPRGGKTFGRSDSENTRSGDEGADSKPKRFSKSFGDKDERSSRPKYSRPADNERPSDDRRDSGSRGGDKFDRSEKSGDKKGFFSKLSRGGKSFEHKHDSDFGKSVKEFKHDKEEAKEASESSDKIRLNRYISNSGVCSRREADELIKMGLVSVNGTVVTEMGHKVNRKDVIKYDGKTLRAEKPVYILMNKPKGFLTTTKDPEDRNTVMQIIAGAVKERVYPVGRLDRNTTGLLLLTNDGELTDKLSHPSYNVKKIYKVELDKPLTKTDFQKIKDGVQLEEGKAMVDDLAIVSDDGKTVGLEIHIGWNRVIRRIFERLEYQVVKLDRSVYAGLDKKDLSRGHWRFLTKEEVVRLKHYK